MFARSDFWMGLVVGVLAGAFGYKIMSEQQALRAVPAGFPTAVAHGVGDVPVDELMRQKEALEDMIAERQQSVGKAK